MKFSKFTTVFTHNRWSKDILYTKPYWRFKDEIDWLREDMHKYLIQKFWSETVP